MGYYSYLCALLEPLRVYALEDTSISGAELRAAGGELDRVAASLDTAEREGILATAEGEGLSRRERLFARWPVTTSTELRRRAIEALAQINAGNFTLADINRAISGCGIYAVAEETGIYGTIRVTFPETVGVPEGFEQIEKIILDIIPCHLLTDFAFRFQTWAECEARGRTWEAVEAAGHTWGGFEMDVMEDE